MLAAQLEQQLDAMVPETVPGRPMAVFPDAAHLYRHGARSASPLTGFTNIAAALKG